MDSICDLRFYDRIRYAPKGNYLPIAKNVCLSHGMSLMGRLPSGVTIVLIEEQSIGYTPEGELVIYDVHPVVNPDGA